MSDGKTTDDLYHDRNVLALAFATAMNNLSFATDDLRLSGSWRIPDADDADAEEWAIVQVMTPEGQVSWHVPRDLAQQSDVPNRRLYPWDGHDRELKNSRLLSYIGT